MLMIKSLRLWLIAAFLLLLVGIRMSGVGSEVSILQLQDHCDMLRGHIGCHYYGAVFFYLLWFITLVMLALPLTALTTIAGGFLFGTVAGALYAVTGATIGATLFFFMIRHSAGMIVQENYRSQLTWFNDQMRRYGTMYLLALHALVVIPFFVVNILAGLTRVPLTTFVWTTFVGLIPSSLILAFAGSRLMEVNALRDLFSKDIVIAFSLLGALAIGSLVVQHTIMKKGRA